MTPCHQPLGAAAWAVFRIGRARVQGEKHILPCAPLFLQIFLVASHIGQIVQRYGVVRIFF